MLSVKYMWKCTMELSEYLEHDDEFQGLKMLGFMTYHKATLTKAVWVSATIDVDMSGTNQKVQK